MFIFNILVAFCEKDYLTLGDILSPNDSDCYCSRVDLYDDIYSGNVVRMGISFSFNHILFDCGTYNVFTFHPLAFLAGRFDGKIRSGFIFSKSSSGCGWLS